MEEQTTNSQNKKLKKQKIAIILLSIFLAFFAISAIVQFTITMQEREKMAIEISFKDYRQEPNSFYKTYQIQITCQKDQIINVQDFSTKFKDGKTYIQKIIYNNNEYTNEENFIIHVNDINKLTVYVLNNDEPTAIYFKNNKITLGQTKTIVNWNI